VGQSGCKVERKKSSERIEFRLDSLDVVVAPAILPGQPAIHIASDTPVN